MPWCPKVPSPTWRTFLRNHLPDIAAIDMFVVPRRRFRRQHSEASEQGRVRPSRLRPRRQSRRGPPPQGLGKGAPPPRISDPARGDVRAKVGGGTETVCVRQTPWNGNEHPGSGSRSVRPRKLSGSGERNAQRRHARSRAASRLVHPMHRGSFTAGLGALFFLKNKRGKSPAPPPPPRPPPPSP